MQKFPLSAVVNDGDEDEDEVGRYKRLGPDGAIWVSVKSEQGVNEVSPAKGYSAFFFDLG